MANFKVNIDVRMEDGTTKQIVRDVNASNGEAARSAALADWVRFLYRAIDAYKYVKSSGIMVTAS
ncbi:hypothetical protein E3T26_06945 [Cryobacterium sp. TMT1-21]|uniref:hypothetical protein n=1 Tax=Cryobacterium sp. TMT1-21 TaxID=1259234 RepID=UPI001069F285|nr:hypothetical protein [Cryobacterium sp. TMT1-21]TFD15513.1 hypothetical protein E3T26_06945 [Cryobacterium sp. TMT1-21]